MRLYHNNLTPILTFLVTLVLVKPSYSQESHFAPLNPEYVKYEEQKAIVKEKSAGEQEQFYGYIPSPMKFNFGNYDKIKSSINKDIQITGIPAAFDLRDSGYVTFVKNQGGNQYSGNCWAFATIGSLESNWLFNHYGQYDLSEQNMVSCHGYDWGYGEGGNALLAMAYLSRLYGPCPESEDAYLTSMHECHGQLTRQRDVIEGKFLPYDIDLIKSVVMKNGGVYITMRASDISAYYNASDYTWYYTGSELICDHAVLIVGWDDNIRVTGGSSSSKGTTGAWIVKNSWGKYWGDEGYFYLSYYDKAAFSEVMYLPVSVDTSRFDKINMYDELGATTSFRPEKQEYGYALTRFNAAEKENLIKVGTFINSVGTIIDIEIYDDFVADSLTNLLASQYNLSCDFPGYKTFNIMAQVQGDYYVKVKYYTPGYEYPIPVEYPIDGFAMPEITNPGTNWISADGYTWDTIGVGITDMEMDLTIRTYTANSRKPLAHFILTSNEICSSDSVLLVPEGIDTSNTYIWQLLPDGNPAIDTSYLPIYASFDSIGIKEIKLIVSGISGSDTLIQNINFTNNFEIQLVTPTPVISMAKKATIVAISNCDSFIWGIPYDTINRPIIEVSPETVGLNKYTLTAYKNTCFGKDSIYIRANINPAYDDVCNAKALNFGRNGPFKNVDASIEDGEPAPPEGECNAPMQWCEEGGLQNSVWFSFIVPESDSISLITSGFDTQIAVYKADSCTDILNDNFTLVAANDDYFGEDKDFAAALVGLSGLVPGEKYFLQVDGSAGGVEGNFYIEYTDLGGSDIDTNNLDKYILNFDQVSRQLCLSFNAEYIPETLELRIFEVSGTEKYRSKIKNTNNASDFCIDCSANMIGNNVYVIKIKTETINQSEKIYIPRLQ